MSDDNENDLGDVRYRSMQTGVVVRRDDPLNLSRVRVRIPGLVEPESAWAFPLGTLGGGFRQRGAKFTPPLGAEVAIFFKGGDPDQPWYLPAHWGLLETTGSEALSSSKDLPAAEAPDVSAIETDRWEFVFDDRVGKQRLIIRDKRTDDHIELDGVTPGIRIKATAGLILECDGIITINGASVIINGRKVSDGAADL